MIRIFSKWLVLCLLATCAEARPEYYIPTVPADLAPVEFYLLTAGVSQELYTRFGHTGIRVKNLADATDVVFNWGQFSFEDPAFAWHFFRGQLTYSMGVRTFQREVANMMLTERRLYMEKLTLTDAQKRSLFTKLAWNSQPENRDFPYQYWFKNCATIPRDYLNEALGGQIQARFGQVMTGKVFRDYVRRNLGAAPFIVPVLDLAMNSNVDREITAWEEMFLPARLREYLLTMPAVDDSGHPVPGTQLLTGSHVLLDKPESFAAPFNDYLVLVAPILGPLAVGFFALARRGTNKIWFRALGLATAYYGAVGGVIGLMLALDWAFSGHPDGWHNANLFLFWPTDFLFAGVGLPLLWRGEAKYGALPRLARFMASAHVLSFALLVLLKLTGVIAQDVAAVALWWGLPIMLVLACLYRWLRPADQTGAPLAGA